ncbi:hypothetical protein PTKIN_Ptkin02bG0053200 [Pterospermum kingtungense]
MASSGLKHKLEADVEIEASPEKFHDLFCNRPHKLHHTCTDKVQGCELLEGEFGTVGSKICWSYFHDGKYRKAKQVIEAIDPEKNSITFKMLEGDLMEEYKTFVITIQASPKKQGEGSVVHWHLDYEMLHEQIDHPETLLQFFREISAAMDSHLIRGF